MTVQRRNFLKNAGSVLSAIAGLGITKRSVARGESASGFPRDGEGLAKPAIDRIRGSQHVFNGAYTGECLEQIAFPLGGIGSGMVCLEGNGSLSSFSLRHHPDLDSKANVFAAISIAGKPRIARVLEGPVPKRELRPRFPDGEGLIGSVGLPRF